MTQLHAHCESLARRESNALFAILSEGEVPTKPEELAEAQDVIPNLHRVHIWYIVLDGSASAVISQAKRQITIAVRPCRRSIEPDERLAIISVCDVCATVQVPR